MCGRKKLFYFINSDEFELFQIKGLEYQYIKQTYVTVLFSQPTQNIYFNNNAYNINRNNSKKHNLILN